MKNSIFMINYGRKERAFDDFTKARANAIKMLKERKREGEIVIGFSEQVCPIDFDHGKHKITMYVQYKRRPWDNGGYPAYKHYSITIKHYAAVDLAPTDPIFRMN